MVRFLIIPLVACLLATAQLHAADPSVKVFILAGQSNMEGKAPNSLLDHQATDASTKELFAHLRKDDRWIVRDDVFIKFLDRKGPLTVGCGSPGRTGAELEFGTRMGNHFEEPVVLVKAAWGGHSLYKLFRSPSAEYPAAEVLQKELDQAQARVKQSNEKNKKNDALPTMEDIQRDYGLSYRNMMKEVKTVMDNPGALFPELAGKKPELAGFVWFQGWNDQYGAENEYASNMRHFIKDVRRDLHSPNLPFVIAAMGQNGSKPAAGAMLTIREAQLAMNEVPEFRGNVKAFRTDLLVDKAAEELYPTWQKNIEQWKLTGGDHPYHYLGSAIWFNRIGQAMGDAMLELIKNPPAAEARHFTEQVKPLFAKHCHGCHSGAKPKGDFAIDNLSLDFADLGNREQWLTVLKQVKEGAMPPKGKPRPPAQDVQALVDWIGGRAAAAETARNAAQGRVVLRRLNRTEYANTVRDLLGVTVDLEDLLPLDTSTSGFDNSAEALHVSSYLMENYLEAADRVLDAAIVNGPRPWTIDKRFDIKDEKSVKPTGSVYRHVDDGVAIFSSWVSANIQVTLWNFRTRFRGKYRFRISAHGIQTDKPVNFHVTAGTLSAVTEERILDYYSVPPDQPTVVEFVEQLEPQNCIRIVADGLGALPPEVERVGAENYKGPGLVVQWVEIQGPLLDTWPPTSHRLIFGDLKQESAPLPELPHRKEVVSEQPLVDAERILRDFARRAFRRTVTDNDIQPFLTRIRAKLDQGYSFEQAMRVGLKAVLVSPHFLFLREKGGTASPATPPDGATRLAGSATLDDFALASRLSYFLWSSMPDEELLQLAEQGKLHQPEMLREQVERLLRDPKSKAFTENFAGQWLGLRAIDSTMPEHMLYPEYDDILKVSMVKETLLFFEEVLKNDLSLTNFVASDFSMLNGRLAKHYGIPGVEGLDFRKLQLPPESHRGGVLTMAAVLKVTANGTTTSPILHGAWVLDRMLGTPPPKPTVDVEAVEPDIRGATTIRNQLAKHRENGECASCHAEIDPPGFALENFDVIGGWREHYRKINEGEPVTINGRRVRYLNGPAVDAADVLPDGRRFQNIDEYKQLLLNDKDQLARALAEKLLGYATGAAPTSADAPQMDALVARVREQNYGFRSLIHEIVRSESFRSK